MNVSSTLAAVERKRQARRVFWGDVAIRLVFIALLLALWQAAHYFLVTKPGDVSRGALFPAPLQVAQWLWDGFALSYLAGTYQPPQGEEMPVNFWAALKQSEYPSNIGVSIWRLLQGYFLATVIGFPLGLLVARSPLAEKTFGWVAVSL
jgi:ABC-type nitrate/sulfonate/bicarbonate transport system permease component